MTGSDAGGPRGLGRIHVEHGGRGGREGSQKIIIEDFVQTKGSSLQSSAREGKRKRKQHVLTPAPHSAEFTRDVLQKQLSDKLGEDTGSAPRDSHEAIVENKYSGHTDGGNKYGGNADGSNTDGGNKYGGNADGSNTDGGNKYGGNADGGNTDGTNTDGGNPVGGDRGGMDSFENQLDDSMDRSAGREDWAIGESRFRRKLSPHQNDNNINSHSSEKEFVTQGKGSSSVLAPQTHRESGALASQGEPLSQRARARASDSSGERRKDNDIEYTKDKPRQDHWTSSEVAPVKVVMKSNLTFNLGNEFFSWKNKATKDLVTEFLGELAIPPNNSNETARQPDAMRARPEYPTPTPSQHVQHSQSSQNSASHSESSSDSSGE